MNVREALIRPASAALVAAAMAACLAAPAHAQFAVIDAANLGQTSVSALQNVAAVEKQISQYELQLQQFEAQQMNLTSPLTQIYGLALQDIQGAQNDVNGLNRLTNGGSMQSYLQQLSNPSAATPASTQQLLSLQNSQLQSQVTGAQTLNTHIQGQGQNLQSVLQGCSSSAVGTTQTTGCLNQIEGLNTQATLELETLVNTQMQTQAAQQLAAASAQSSMDQAAYQGFASQTGGWTENASANDMSTYANSLPQGTSSPQ
jgi:type IV secretion system protein TrbJ